MDGDGSFDPDDLAPLLDRRPRGPRRPGGRPPPPGPARGLALARPAGNALVVRVAAPPDRAARPRHRADAGLPRDGPARPRRAGPGVRLPRRADATAPWPPAGGSPSTTSTYHPRAAGTRSKVSGSVRGTAADRPRLRPGAAVMHDAAGRWSSPRRRSPGLVKTRLGAEVGMDVAAELAAAALLDTLGACAAAVGVDRCRLALDGRPGRPPCYADELAAALERLDRAAAARRRPGASGSRTPTSTWPRRTQGAGRPDRHGHPAGHRGRPDRGRRAARRPDDAVLGRRRGRRLVGARRCADPRDGRHLRGVPDVDARPPASDTRAALAAAGLAVGDADACCATWTRPRTPTAVAAAVRRTAPRSPDVCADGPSRREASVEAVFADAFRGDPCVFVGPG